jgi:quercetin dioxygenase-like cupin family protein
MALLLPHTNSFVLAFAACNAEIYSPERKGAQKEKEPRKEIRVISLLVCVPFVQKMHD